MPPSRDGVGRGSLPAPRTHPSSAARPEHGCLRPWLVTALPRHAGHGWQRGSSPGTGVPAPAPQQHPACPTLGPGCFTPWPGCLTSRPSCPYVRPRLPHVTAGLPHVRLSPRPPRPGSAPPRPGRAGPDRPLTATGGTAGPRPAPCLRPAWPRWGSPGTHRPITLAFPPAPSPQKPSVPPRTPALCCGAALAHLSASPAGRGGRPACPAPPRWGVTRTPGAPGHPKATHGAQHCTAPCGFVWHHTARHGEPCICTPWCQLRDTVACSRTSKSLALRWHRYPRLWVPPAPFLLH